MFIYLSKKVSIAAPATHSRCTTTRWTRGRVHMMSLFLCVLTDRHSQQYPPQVCLLEQRSRLHCLWGRRWSAQGAQVGNAVRWLHTHPLCFVLKGFFPLRFCLLRFIRKCESVCVESHHWMATWKMLTDDNEFVKVKTAFVFVSQLLYFMNCLISLCCVVLVRLTVFPLHWI